MNAAEGKRATGAYSAASHDGLVVLGDTAHATTLTIATTAGNNAFDLNVGGHHVLWCPHASADALARARYTPGGIPVLAPWANRLDEPAFHANGRRYAFDLDLGNVAVPHPIHGLVRTSDAWRVVALEATGDAAWVTTRLEFFREPDLMRQFPFAHTIAITHRLVAGAVEVTTRIDNLSSSPMPAAIGFHPYFQLDDAPRDEWRVSIGARTEWVLSPDKLPTGERRPLDHLLPEGQPFRLGGHDLDHVFGDLERDAGRRARLRVEGRRQALTVTMGPRYHAAVVFAPPDRPFICFEPMAAITNALNLAHRGLYDALDLVPPGEHWEEHFRIEPSGF